MFGQGTFDTITATIADIRRFGKFPTNFLYEEIAFTSTATAVSTEVGSGNRADRTGTITKGTGISV